MTDPAPIARAPTGTSFEISRRLAGESGYTLIGIAGERFYNDQEVPAGITHLSYRVRAWRGGKSSPYSENVVVYFGIPPTSLIKTGELAA